MNASSLQQDLEQLVREQVRTFKHSPSMDDADVFEFHLRHYQIMALCREKDRQTGQVAKKGSYPGRADD